MKSDRVRIADIAKETGLSRSTIDRVLNGRQGVQARTRKRVEDALAALGYSKSTLEFLSLHRNQNIAVFTPTGSNPFFEMLSNGIASAAKDLAHFGCNLSFHNFDPYSLESLVSLMQSIDPEVDAVITLGADTPEVVECIDALAARGVRVVTYVSDAPQSQRALFIGQDNYAAGRTAARLMSGMIGDGAGSIAILLSDVGFRHLLDRQSGFQQVMRTARPDLHLSYPRPFGTTDDSVGQMIQDLVEKSAALKGVYIAGGGQPSVIEALRKMECGPLAVIGHEMNDVTRSGLKDGTLSAIICHDVYEVGTKTITAALGRKERYDTSCEIRIYLRDNLPLPRSD